MSTEIIAFVTQYSLVSSYTIFPIGIIGNLLNILVFIHLKLFRDNRCAFYLTVESISNFLYQFYPITATTLTAVYGDEASGHSLFWCKFRYMWSQTFVLITFFTICFAAIDQFFSTDYLFNLRQMCTLKVARCITFVSACVWIIHSIVSGLFYDIQPSLGCLISNRIWLQYSTYFFFPVLTGLLPIIISSFFSILAFRNVRRIVRKQLPIVRRRLDRQMTAMVLIRVVVFVFFALPYTINRIYIINFPLVPNKPMEYAIGRLVQVILGSIISLNYAVSFYVFFISSSRFRRQFKLVMVKKIWPRCKSLCCCSHNQVRPGSPESVGGNMELE